MFTHVHGDEASSCRLIIDEKEPDGSTAAATQAGGILLFKDEVNVCSHTEPWIIEAPRRISAKMSHVSVKTGRLLLRRWRDDDVEPFAAMCSDPEVMRYIGSGATRTRAQAQASIEASERGWEENGFGLFAVERLEDGRFLGFTGLSEPTFLPEIMPAVEIGWRFVRQSWGNGYASEAALAALDFGLVTLGIPEIVSIHQVENHASGRIMKKLGMRFDRETLDPSCGRAVRVYRTFQTSPLGREQTFKNLPVA